MYKKKGLKVICPRCGDKFVSDSSRKELHQNTVKNEKGSVGSRSLTFEVCSNCLSKIKV
jgi:uncharacterized Zn finger protein (UPF0148 family)